MWHFRTNDDEYFGKISRIISFVGPLHGVDLQRDGSNIPNHVSPPLLPHRKNLQQRLFF